jgi:hypothetical protein
MAGLCTLPARPAPFETANVPPDWLRADIARRYGELFALGWLGRAYLFAPPVFEAAFPAVFRLESYEDGTAVQVDEDGAIDVTLRESSVVQRGIPFRLRLETADDGGSVRSIQSASLRGIGCDVVRAARGASGQTLSSSEATTVPTTADSLCDQINGDRRTKRLVVRAIASTIFRRLSPVAVATRRGECLEACGAPMSFVPRHDLWAVEGSAAKWLQQVSAYYFAEATLEDVRYASAAGTTFTFYFDATEPTNSDDPRRNVNPEVVHCAFAPDDEPPVADEARESLSQ